MKTQISLRIRAVSSESFFSVWRNFVSIAIQNAPSEDSDQTAQIQICILTGRSCPKVLSDVAEAQIKLLT